MAGTFSKIVVHVVFSTKDRLPMMTASTRGIVFPYLGGIVKGMGGSMLMAGGSYSRRMPTVCGRTVRKKGPSSWNGIGGRSP